MIKFFVCLESDWSRDFKFSFPKDWQRLTMLVSKLGKSAIPLLISGLTCRLLESLAEAFKGSDESCSVLATE